MSKPNIVFIYSDQHRGDAVGCAGHPVIKTPHLDRLRTGQYNVFEDPDLVAVRRDLIDTHLSGIRDRLDREKLEIYQGI
jgi:hypothetical protein